MGSLLTSLKSVSLTSIADGMNSIWSGLGSAMSKIKDAIYAILPELMTFMGDAWIILIPFALFVIIKILNSFRRMVQGF